MTSTAMVVCPRTSEAANFPSSNSNEGGEGIIEVNGTLLAGSLMVKTKKDWDALREDDSKFQELLNAIGVPRSAKHDGDVLYV